jgi:preprotein translocase subunit YajC
MIDLFIASANAQDATAAVAQQSPLMQFVPLAVVFGIFYFLMIKPQQKKLKEEQAMLAALNRGDEVYTKSGLLGKIYGLTEKVVTLDVGENTKLKVVRSQIAGKSDTILKEQKK